MYLLKNIRHEPFTGNIIVDNGIEVVRLSDGTFESLNPFWGKTNINICPSIDISKFTTTNHGKNYFLLPYVSDFSNNEDYVKNIGDGSREFLFNVNDYKPEEKEGYIVFIRESCSLNSMNTNGEKIFGRYYCQEVVILRDGDYIEFEDHRIEVINNQLMLTV